MAKPGWKAAAAIAAALLIAGGILVALLANDSGREAEGEHAPENALLEKSKEGYETHAAVFEVPGEEASSGEASRSGPRSPAAEQVLNRAYPRRYVDDRIARRTHAAFEQIPVRPRRDTFSSDGLFQFAAGTLGAWTELGPGKPDVAGEASQFYDPNTQTGPPTQESGRVTALAIDPACAPTDCKLWVAAAGGGIWRTNDALAANVQWIPPPDDLPTTSFGSLIYDATDNTLYAGSGEPNGSSDSEAGLGLFKSTDSGASWTLVPGSAAVATNRAIGAIAVDPNDANTLYIGTDLARHGMAAVWGGRRTPPNAPALGVYRSTDGGQTFSLETDLHTKTPPDWTPPSSGQDFFAGGVNQLQFDPNDPNMLYASVFGYGVWRADQSAQNSTWGQVFHTVNQNDFCTGQPTPCFNGDSSGDVTKFDMVDLGSSKTRMYLGDASDDYALDGNDTTPLAQAFRHDDVGSITPDTSGQLDNTTAGWKEMSNPVEGTKGFAVYNWCQNGQCNYDAFVAHPPGADPGTVWYGGSMNYDELPLYDQGGTGAPPRSNGRAVVRSTNAGADPTTDAIAWQDQTAILTDPSQAWGVKEGLHPDLHAIAFANGGQYAFIGSDGGVVRIDDTSTQDQSDSCDARTYDYTGTGAAPTPLLPPDLANCKELLNGVPNAVTPLNDGLRTLQFQSVSTATQSPGSLILGGTQDNGTFSYDASRPASDRWFESVGGDGGQSGFDPQNTQVRYHNYFDATPEVNFQGDDPQQWLDIYDPLQLTGEDRSFYTPFIADQTTPGRLFTGLAHVWRTNDSGGNEQALKANGCYAVALDPDRPNQCGDWQPIGGNLTGSGYGTTRQGEFVAALARAPSDAGTLWAATRTGRLFVTSSSGASPGAVVFHRIDTPSTPGRFISAIDVDPADPNHAYVSYSGYNAYTPTTPGHVFDVHYNPATGTATFTDLSHNLGDQPVTGIAYDAGRDDLFAATDWGVLELPSGSSQWLKAGSGMPEVAVYNLTLSDSARVLLAGTHGRGAYRLDLPPPTPRPQPTPAGARLKKVGKVRKGRRSVIRGVASDAGGIGSVTLKFGDRHSRRVRPRANGSFTVRHRYRRKGAFTVRLIVVGTDGDRATATRRARVKPRHRAHPHG